MEHEARTAMTRSTSSEAAASRGNVRGEQTRSRLLDAALRSFAARGFHGTGTRDIAEAAGMSPAAVYVHYRTKEELLFELSLAGHRHVLELITTAAGRRNEPDEQLREVVRQ